MEIKMKPRYKILRVLHNGEVVVFDYKTNGYVIMKYDEWDARRGFTMLVVDGQIVP